MFDPETIWWKDKFMCEMNWQHFKLKRFNSGFPLTIRIPFDVWKILSPEEKLFSKRVLLNLLTKQTIIKSDNFESESKIFKEIITQ